MGFFTDIRNLQKQADAVTAPRAHPVDAEPGEAEAEAGATAPPAAAVAPGTPEPPEAESD
jgi:hypothetical protein